MLKNQHFIDIHIAQNTLPSTCNNVILCSIWLYESYLHSVWLKSIHFLATCITFYLYTKNLYGNRYEVWNLYFWRCILQLRRYIHTFFRIWSYTKCPSPAFSYLYMTLVDSHCSKFGYCISIWPRGILQYQYSMTYLILINLDIQNVLLIHYHQLLFFVNLLTKAWRDDAILGLVLILGLFSFYSQFDHKIVCTEHFLPLILLTKDLCW
jgi:hypothetical protein